MSDLGRGLPLLSGQPQYVPSETCRKCSKEFNILFARSRSCNHCGYSYCHNCSDYQALMPRSGQDATTGYDAMSVCAYCIEFLTITAAGRNHLKALPPAKLKKYINAYNIKIDRAVEKDDLIDAILSARGPNGCLPRANEEHYRKYSVPSKGQTRSRGLFSRSSGGQSSSAPPQPPPRPTRTPTQEFARPDLAPDDNTYPPPPPRSTRPQQQQQQQQYTAPPYPPPPRPHSAFPQASPHNPPPQFHTPPPRQTPSGGYYQQPQAPPMPMPHPAPPHGYHPQVPPQPMPSAYSRSQGPPPQNYHTRPAPAAAPPPPPPPSQPRPRATSSAPPPTLAQLLTMDADAISALSIGALKAVLFTNHVNAGQILEKSDLVAKVRALVEDEKMERARQRAAEEREQLEMMRREQERQEEVRHRALAAERERERERAATESMQDGSDGAAEPHVDDEPGENEPEPHDHEARAPSPPRSVPEAPKAQGSATTLERTGLCVVCQDEEANIAIVDCGHMAMCRGCSDLIMASSRECPLCRTRIVTEARLLRIFRA